jgi:excisionase family DNA binding protein
MTPLAYSIPEVCSLAGAGRTSVYEAINDGKLIAHKRGSRTIIFSGDLQRWLDSLPQVEAKHAKPVGSVSDVPSTHDAHRDATGHRPRSRA